MKRVRLKGMMGWFIVTVLSVSPVALWALMRPLDARFGSIPTTLASTGQMLGLAGMAMFSLTLVLSTRHRALEPLFDGMNKVYAAHHRFGAIAFSLLLFHPIALAINYALAFSPYNAALFLLSPNPNILFGTLALLSMMLFLILTFFVSFAYDKWKITHKFLTASYVLAAIHVLLVKSDTTNWWVLYGYMVLFVAIGIISILYRTIAPTLFTKRTGYIVDEVRKLDSLAVEIFMTPIDRPLLHKPGQFLFISFDDPGVGKEMHPFSITSVPGDERLAITVKTLGDHTTRFKLLTKGTRATIEGPFGTFSYDRHPGKDQLWIAGGIGITPFLSMLRSMPDPRYTIELYYCTKEKIEALFLDELMHIAETHPNIKIISFCSDEHGHLTADVLQARSGDLLEKEIFICGPPMMMQMLREQLIRKKVPLSHIHTEEFKLR